MALPYGYATPSNYFKDALRFLNEFSWIYQEANTCFVKANILEKMPQEFYEYFQYIDNEQLNKFPLLQQNLNLTDIPEIGKFRQQLKTLIPAEAFKEPLSFKTTLSVINFKKINLKKQHEIQILATFINHELMPFPLPKDNNEKISLIDFGCGLGYLSEYLYRLNENFLILGLESDLYRVETAQKRLQQYMPANAKHAIHYRQQFITKASKDFIIKSMQELCQSNYKTTAAIASTSEQPTDTLTVTPSSDTHSLHIPSNRMTIIGLHACADLTITSMKLFLDMSQVRCLIIMPCCYHKMQMCEQSLKFQNFPLSRSLKQEVSSEYINNSTTFLNRPFLRLACQQTLKRWQKCSEVQHAKHGREMFLRAIAEALKQETEIVVKCKENVTIDLLTGSCIKFDTFSRLYQLKTKAHNTTEEWTENHRRQYEQIMEKYPNGEQLAEGLTCLQTAMQKLCENLVLYDRLCYLQEAASDLKLKLNVRYEKLMDEELSPRCYVLIAEKL